MAAKTEEWIVVFVFAELLALALVVGLSCWCCRRAGEEEEVHALPVTQATRSKASSQRATHTQTQSTAVTGATATAGLDSRPGSDANDDDDDDDRESHDDDGASLVSSGLWSFLAGGATLNKPRRNSKKKRGSGGGDVEVVNISVNTAEDDEDKTEPGAAALDKRGSAA